jgi:hypothetical protein
MSATSSSTTSASKSSSTGLTIFTYTANPGTPSADALSLLGSLAATRAAEQMAQAS